MIEVRINGEKKKLEAGLTVTELLSALGVPPQNVMIERNREVVRREWFDREPVENGDRLELIRLIGGG